VPGATDVRFDGDGLRDGGREASAVADAAAAVAGLIAGITIDGAAFGALPEAATLGTVLTAFRDDHAALGRQVQAAHGALADRAAGAAGEGDRMVRDTTAQARSVP
jgi:hypothetical protein